MTLKSAIALSLLLPARPSCSRCIGRLLCEDPQLASSGCAVLAVPALHANIGVAACVYKFPQAMQCSAHMQQPVQALL